MKTIWIPKILLCGLFFFTTEDTEVHRVVEGEDEGVMKISAM